MTTITGGGGLKLHVVETGNPTGQPIVFLHGFSQSWRSWSRQWHSDLATDYRLVALDLRGHGDSEKPRDAYADSRLWADDLHAVLQELGLTQPVLCGWSYGSLMILDYLRYYGEEAIGGIHFVDALSRLGSNEAMAVISAELRSLVPGLFATDVEESVRALIPFLHLCFLHQPTDEELLLMLGYNVAVPPHVRQALFSRSVDNDDVLRQIRGPMLISHGAADAIVSLEVIDQHRACVPHAQVSVLANTGHSPFWEAPDAFNKELRAFCTSLRGEVSSTVRGYRDDERDHAGARVV